MSLYSIVHSVSASHTSIKVSNSRPGGFPRVALQQYAY